MTKVKICGLRRPQDVEAVNASRPDYAGLILAAGFRRTVDRETAQALRRALSRDIPLVGVFVDDDPAVMADYLDSGIIDIAQLHGREPAQTVRALQARTGRPVWKVFQMTAETDRREIEESPADLVLLDAGTGCGQRFDWSLAAGIRRPFVLAGGLTPENVAAAVAQTRPFAVDTSSGVETDGWKDSKKIAAFVEAVRRTGL